jgi:pseudouridine-5'-phosphate glycosidase
MHRVDSAAGAAAVIAAHMSIPGVGGILMVQRPPLDVALDADEVEGWIAEALAEARARGVRGAEVTPYVLGHIARASEGRALRANIGLIIDNARMAGAIAVALAAATQSGG